MGISYVAAYSTKEKDALRVKLADEAVCTGKSPSSQSQQDFRNGKVDKAFIVKHEEELVAPEDIVAVKFSCCLEEANDGTSHFFGQSFMCFCVSILQSLGIKVGRFCLFLPFFTFCLGTLFAGFGESFGLICKNVEHQKSPSFMEPESDKL
ncbi:PREDICTED: uncharacterized protein LOC104808915 isoform X2 [Tarenaya hassleriana]|uniref:uncharacterized protein LOC104808915 isoform X2 n=1 Tax=Tarenaya hassleriana TaxID=28532 RepID=UPI00053CA68B|nr:PREDICTED: uncharacterized protein LOC104808915 isoform X2 [Tarenaya hassleriana]